MRQSGLSPRTALSSSPPRDRFRRWSPPSWAGRFEEAGGGTRRVMKSSGSRGAVRAAPSVLVCRLVRGKITLVHRRLWAAVARIADRLPADRVAKIVEVHTSTGRHRVDRTRFPDWVPPLVLTEAASLSERGGARGPRTGGATSVARPGRTPLRSTEVDTLPTRFHDADIGERGPG